MASNDTFITFHMNDEGPHKSIPKSASSNRATSTTTTTTTTTTNANGINSTPGESEHKSIEMVPLIDDLGVNMDEMNETEEGRVGLLLSAAAKNNFVRLEFYLNAGISPNASDYDRRTALHLAAAEGAMECAKLLIERGADVNARDRYGATAIDDAVSHKRVEMVEFLKENGANHGAPDKHEALLFKAALEGNVEDATVLLKSNVNPSCIDYDRRTPLHIAVAEQKLDMIKLLLQYKADVKAEDRWGLTPIGEAMRLATRTGTDPLKEIFEPYMDSQKHGYFSAFSVFFLIWEIIMIGLIGGFCRYDPKVGGQPDCNDSNSPACLTQNWPDIYQVYPLYQDVHVMIFIGFGFLMVFLRKNSYTSVGYTFLIGAFSIQWYQLTSGFWEGVFDSNFTKPNINIQRLVRADFCAGSVLITFGVVLGKVSPFQMMWVALVENIFYALNEEIAIKLGIADLGGTMVIHMFGAYFGIALSLVCTPKEAHGNPHNAAVYHSDTMAMIGTIFLWLFWPSFNGALGTGNTQSRAIVNTVLSLCGSCVVAFLSSHILRKENKFNMVDIQNATLAGGVAMGAACDMIIQPGSAIAIGAIAGFVSVFGYTNIQPWLEEKIGLHDTCGVNNLHGMPSIIGGFAAVIAASQSSQADSGLAQLLVTFPNWQSRGGNKQAAYQFAFMCITIGIGLTAGSITGLMIKWKSCSPITTSERMFVDSDNWEVPRLEIPYYFDHRGEIARGASNTALVEPESQAVEESREVQIQNKKLLEARFASLESQLAALNRKQMRVGGASSPASSPVPGVGASSPSGLNGSPNALTRSLLSYGGGYPMVAPPPFIYPSPYAYPGASSYATPQVAPSYTTTPQVAPVPPPPAPASSSASNTNLERMMEMLLQKLDANSANTKKLE